MAKQGGRDSGETQELLGLAFVAAVEPPASGRPGHSPLHHPSMPAESRGGLDSSPGDPWGDAAAAKPPPKAVVVASLVGVELAGASASRSAPGADRRNASDQRRQSLAVVEVRARDAQRQRHSSGWAAIETYLFLAPQSLKPLIPAKAYTPPPLDRDPSRCRGTELTGPLRTGP